EVMKIEGVELIEVTSGTDALLSIARQRPDCVVLNPRVPDLSADEFVDRLVATGIVEDLPMLVQRTNGTPADEAASLKRLGQSALLREVRRPQRLLDLATLFLHLRLEGLPDPQRKMITDLHGDDRSLAGRKVLIVDDDVRNI